MSWLDFLLFGNGRGLAAPAMDQKFYWLVDGRTKRGRMYQWSGWFGCQLANFQWRHPRIGEERYLCGRLFRIFASRRRWLRVQCCWAMKLPDDIDKANAELRDLQSKIGSWQP